MKKIIVLLIAITLFILPVSAEELAIGEWGIGVVRPRSVDMAWTQNARKITNFPFTLGDGVATNNLYFFAQFGWLPDYTYTVTIEFKTSQLNFFKTDKLDIFTAKDYTVNTNNDTYQNVKWNIENGYYFDTLDYPFTVTFTEEYWDHPEYPNSLYKKYTYTIIFSNAVIGLEDMEYILGRFNKQLPSVSVDIIQPNMDVSAYYDPGGIIYEELVVELLQDILNSGSDKIDTIPSNGGELAGTVSDLDRAEQDIYDRSDELLSSVQPQLDNYITQASNSAESFLPVAGFVTNIFTKTKEVLPPYVVILFTVIPLLLFVGWLIGRFK